MKQRGVFVDSLHPAVSSPLGSAPVSQSNSPIEIAHNEKDGLVVASTRQPVEKLTFQMSFWERVRQRPVWLNEEVHPLQFVLYLFAVFSTIAILTFVASMQSKMLMGKHGVNYAMVGNVVGRFQFMDQIVSMVFTEVWGVVSHVIGRGWTFGAGFVVMGSFLIGMGFAENSEPAMLVCRALFGIGGAAATTMITGVLGDMLGKGHRGKLSCINSFRLF